MSSYDVLVIRAFADDEHGRALTPTHTHPKESP